MMAPSFAPPSLTQLLSWSVLAVLAYWLYSALSVLLKPYISGLRYVPMPEGKHWFFGHIPALYAADDFGLLEEEWVRDSHVVKFKGLFNVSLVFHLAYLWNERLTWMGFHP